MLKVGCALLVALTGCAGKSRSDGGAEAGGFGSFGGSPPACVADGTVTAPAAPVSGSVVGAQVRAALCLGGATALVEITQDSFSVPSQTLLFLSSAATGDARTNFAFQLPTQAVTGHVVGNLGMTGLTPGVYSSETNCGGLALCVVLPIPEGLVCSGSTDCAAGCALQGPVSDPTCQPVTPTLCYGASAAASCAGGTTPPSGSWSLTLTSVEADSPDMTGLKRFGAHGNLTAELLNSDDSNDSSQLSVAF